jgi:hypothetical protein
MVLQTRNLSFLQAFFLLLLSTSTSHGTEEEAGSSPVEIYVVAAQRRGRVIIPSALMVGYQADVLLAWHHV